jgi:hypothetical protein
MKFVGWNGNEARIRNNVLFCRKPLDKKQAQIVYCKESIRRLMSSPEELSIVPEGSPLRSSRSTEVGVKWMETLPQTLHVVQEEEPSRLEL